MIKGACTEFSYDQRADFDWRRKHNQFTMGQEEETACKRAYNYPFGNGRIPKVPFTQPRRFLWSFNNGNQINGRLDKNAYRGFCRKLYFEQSTDGENVQSVNKPAIEKCELPSDSLFSADYTKAIEISDKDSSQNCKFTSAVSMGYSDATNVENLKSAEKLEKGWRKTFEISTCEIKKSWADMVEEERELQSWRSDLAKNNSRNHFQEFLLSYQTPSNNSTCSFIVERFNDENVDSYIICKTPTSLNQAENLSRKVEVNDLSCKFYTQPYKTILSVNQPVWRSLCFDYNQKPGTEEIHCASPLQVKALNFEGQTLVLSEDCTSTKSMKQRNRLQVFQDITHIPGSHRPDIMQRDAENAKFVVVVCSLGLIFEFPKNSFMLLISE